MALSNAPSIAESTASQLDTKMKANQTKLKLRQLFKNVDQDKTSKIKESVFTTILQLHGVALSKSDM